MSKPYTREELEQFTSWWAIRRTAKPSAILTLDKADRLLATARAGLEDQERRTIAEVRECVPQNWLDPMLSGPASVLQAGPHGRGDDIERVLNAVRDRIFALYNKSTERSGLEAEASSRQTALGDHAACSTEGRLR